MSSPSIGLVIGVVVGIVAAVAIVVFFNSWLTRRRDNLELQASMMSGIPTPVVRKMGKCDDVLLISSDSRLRTSWS